MLSSDTTKRSQFIIYKKETQTKFQFKLNLISKDKEELNIGTISDVLQQGILTRPWFSSFWPCFLNLFFVFLQLGDHIRVSMLMGWEVLRLDYWRPENGMFLYCKPCIRLHIHTLFHLMITYLILASWKLPLWPSKLEIQIRLQKVETHTLSYMDNIYILFHLILYLQDTVISNSSSHPYGQPK